jgi:tetratricopeptide (TPR) repeat protein
MLIGQKPNEAVTLLSEARKMVDAKAQAPQPQAAPVQQAAVQQAAAPQPAPTAVAQAQTPPPAAPVVPKPAPVAAPVAAAQLATPQLAAASPLPGIRLPQLAPRRATVPPQVLTTVANKEPNGARNATYWYRQGRYLSEQENFEEAVQAFTQAIQIDPTLALALNARGYALLRLRRYQDAIADCSQAIRLNPAYANAYLNRSVAKRALGDITGAREDKNHAAELDGLAQAQATLSKPATRP